MDVLIKAATKVPTVPKDANSVERVQIGKMKLVVDDKLLKPIKSLCKKDPAQIDEAKRYLFLDLFSNKLVVRVRSLRIIDALFLRSSIFRSLVCDDMRELLKSGSLIDAPPLQPSSRDDGIVYFERQILHTLELWDVQFGQHHPTLRATARYLRESLKKKMPNVTERAVEYEDQRKRREAAQSRVMKAKRAQLFTETSEELPELEDDVRKMEEYFDILIPDLRNLMSHRTLALVVNDGNDDGVSASADKQKSSEDIDGTNRKRPREEQDGEEDDDIDWEDDDEDADVGGTTETLEDHIAAKAPAVDTLALNPMPITVDLHRDREDLSAEGAGKGIDKEVTRIMKKHAMYLARSALPRLQRWQDFLVKAKTGAGTGGSEGEGEGEWAAAQVTGSLLRKIAILNARLRRLLLEKCSVMFKDLPLTALVLGENK